MSMSPQKDTCMFGLELNLCALVKRKHISAVHLFYSLHDHITLLLLKHKRQPPTSTRIKRSERVDTIENSNHQRREMLSWLKKNGTESTEIDVSTIVRRPSRAGAEIQSHLDDGSPQIEELPRQRRLSGLAKAASLLKSTSERLHAVGTSRRKLYTYVDGSHVGEGDLEESASNRARVLSGQYDIDIESQSDSESASGDQPKRLWIPNEPAQPWCLTEILALSKDKMRVTALIPSTGQVRNMLREDTRGFDESHLLPDTADLGQLNDLHEASALSVLEARFRRDLVYTMIGDILVSVNPYRSLPSAFPIPYTSNAPHLFTVTGRAVNAFTMSHSILINGESGAGKTESAKHIMRYISQTEQRRATAESAEVRRKVAQTTPLLEAFGNAKTTANSNSSRFGRYVQVIFNHEQEISGSNIRHFLLESNRATTRPSNERSFHIFYQLCIGLDSRSRQALHLSSDPNEHIYLQGFTLENPSEDDELAKRFLETSAALECVGATEVQRKGIWSALAFILRLGDILFDPSIDEETCSVAKGLFEAANILQVDPDILSVALTRRIIHTGRNRDVTEIPLSAVRSRNSRDGLARAMYSKIFDWVVSAANSGTTPSAISRFIGVLDMVGFEVVEENGFEQLLINYASEVLQAVFNDAVLQSEKLFYLSEGVDASRLVLSDNADLLRLFNPGFFPLLDDITLLEGKDEQLLGKILEFNRQSQVFCLDPFRPSTRFVVKHFAGPVTYSISGFTENNRGRFFNLLARLTSSTPGFISQDLMKQSADDLEHRTTVSKAFRDSLNQMMVQIRSTKCHFVRCVRPNHASEAMVFDTALVNNQLLRLGVYEAVRLRREGFPIRVPYDDIVRGYSQLLTGTKEGNSNDLCERILVEGFGESARGKKWQLGERTYVFLSSRAIIELDLEMRRRAAEEEVRRAKLAKEERDRVEREERQLAEQQERMRAEEEAMRKKAAEAAEERRRQEEEETRRKLELIRLEQTRLRKQREEEEAQRAELERRSRYAAATVVQKLTRGRAQRQRFALLLCLERARVAELERSRKERDGLRLKQERQEKATVCIQKFVRGVLVRRRYHLLQSYSSPFKRALRSGEVVLKSTLVVRVQANDVVRAIDTIVGAQGKVAGVARKASVEIGHAGSSGHVTIGLNQKRRYMLLLTRGRQGASLLLVDPTSLDVKDEMIVVESGNRKTATRRKKSSMFGISGTSKESADEQARRIRAVSTSRRDFVVAKHRDDWALTDLLSGAVSWVSLLKNDAKRIPTILEALNTGFFYRDKFTDTTGRVIVKQGQLLMRRVAEQHQKAHWDKRWFVLDEEHLQIFRGEANPQPVAEVVFDEYHEVRLCPKGEEARPFVIDLRRSGLMSPLNQVDIRFQAPNKQDCDAWLVAIGVAIDRAKRSLADERVGLATALNKGHEDHPLMRQLMVSAPHGAGAEATHILLQENVAANGKKKKGFDANAFKQAFKDANKVTMANWE